MHHSFNTRRDCQHRFIIFKYQNVMCNFRMRGEDVIDLNVQKCTICNIYFLFCCSWIIVHYGVAATSPEQTHIRGLIHLVTFLYFIRWCQLSIYLFMHLSVCLSVYLSIHLFILMVINNYLIDSKYLFRNTELVIASFYLIILLFFNNAE